MKILTKPKNNIGKCNECNCTFEFEINDIKIETIILSKNRYVICPNCKKILYLNELKRILKF